MPILPGLLVEDLRESAIRVRDVQSIEDDDLWVVFGFKGKNCLSAQGFRFKENADWWQKKLQKLKLKTKVYPRSQVHFKGED